jgi:hypothetical protein
MPQPNEKLRAARERIESPSAPGEPMTRQELADAINAHIYRVSGGTQVTAVDPNHVGKWERGVIRWPAARYRAALRAILDADTDRDLGFARPPRGKPQDVDRKTFLKTALGASVGATLAGYTPAVAGGDSADVLAALSGPTAHYRHMEQVVSSERLTPAVDAHLALATDIVGGRLRTASGFSVLAEISGLTAWLAADRANNAVARRRYAEAIHFAERTHHPLLVSYMTASLGHFAVESGDPREGVLLLDRAATQLDPSAPSSARAWLASLHAIAHAALRDRASTYEALRSAEHAATRPGEPVWPWVFTFDQAKLVRYQASALARLGDLRGARVAFDAVPATFSAPKPRALMSIEQAQVLAGHGRVDEGCALAVEALRIGREYGSERITSRVRQFRASLPARAAAAHDLDEALMTLYEDHP